VRVNCNYLNQSLLHPHIMDQVKSNIETIEIVNSQKRLPNIVIEEVDQEMNFSS